MKVEQQFKIDRLIEKRDNARNSAEKAMYSNWLKEEEKGICSGCHRDYDMVDWKKELEEDKNKFI